jgi:hypothetical protein
VEWSMFVSIFGGAMKNDMSVEAWGGQAFYTRRSYGPVMCCFELSWFKSECEG